MGRAGGRAARALGNPIDSDSEWSIAFIWGQEMMRSASTLYLKAVQCLAAPMGVRWL